MLHYTSIPWSPERMRRLIFSLICSSGNAANVLKPTSVGITSSQTRIAFGPWHGREIAQVLSLRKFFPSARQINARSFNAWPCRHRAGRWSHTPDLQTVLDYITDADDTGEVAVAQHRHVAHAVARH